MNWISCRDRLPPIPQTPFEVYLVWAVQDKEGCTGTHYLVQFGRDKNDWQPVKSIFGHPVTVTHWCEALQWLGYPEPRPYGPRGGAL